MLGPIIIDTNLLLLLVVGATDPDYIAMHKRLAADYTIHDFDQVSRIAGAHSEIVLLPNTLTEVSNLARQIANPARTRIQWKFKELVQSLTEVYVESRTAIMREEFLTLGLTDAAILHFCTLPLGDLGPTLLSVDEDLINNASSLGYGCIDYNQLR